MWAFLLWAFNTIVLQILSDFIFYSRKLTRVRSLCRMISLQCYAYSCIHVYAKILVLFWQHNLLVKACWNDALTMQAFVSAQTNISAILHVVVSWTWSRMSKYEWTLMGGFHCYFKVYGNVQIYKQSYPSNVL